MHICVVTVEKCPVGIDFLAPRAIVSSGLYRNWLCHMCFSGFCQNRFADFLNHPAEDRSVVNAVMLQNHEAVCHHHLAKLAHNSFFQISWLTRNFPVLIKRQYNKYCARKWKEDCLEKIPSQFISSKKCLTWTFSIPPNYFLFFVCLKSPCLKVISGAFFFFAVLFIEVNVDILPS